MKVSILGLGIMGHGVAGVLAREPERFDVTVWNRTSGKAADLAGVAEAGTAAEAVAEADVILSILFDADSVLSVLDEAAASVPAGAVWVQASTIGVDGTRRVVAAAEKSGVALVEAMMLGTKQPAESGKLVMLAAGDPALLERVEPVLDAMGSKTVVAGDRVGAGTALKLAANAWIATVTAGIAQSIALAEAMGLDGGQFLQAIEGGATDTPYAHVKGAAMLAGDYPASFALDGLRKDIGLIDEAALSAGVDRTVLDALAATFARASEGGHGGDDIASVRAAFS